jgi:hypothetical protein
MRIAYWAVVAGMVLGLAGCNWRYSEEEHRGVHGMTAGQRAGVENEVRRFVAVVGQDVTREGPLAWKKEFEDSSAFFMASEGQLAFANKQAATQGTEAFAKTINHMELRWGDDLRIDALTPELAMVGTTWKEVRVDVEGHTVMEGGYFTGLVEKRGGQWQFRDAHWSVPK